MSIGMMLKEDIGNVFLSMVLVKQGHKKLYMYRKDTLFPPSYRYEQESHYQLLYL